MTKKVAMNVRTPRDLGSAVRAQRRALGLDQASLAQRSGVSRQWIIGLEQGKPRVELTLVLRTLRVIGLTLDIAPEDAAPGGPVDLDDIVANARGRG
jgi:HTH-type transcriptional regulator/antitoxin HipB